MLFYARFVERTLTRALNQSLCFDQFLLEPLGFVVRH